MQSTPKGTDDLRAEWSVCDGPADGAPAATHTQRTEGTRP
jgi:hypothetical protein